MNDFGAFGYGLTSVLDDGVGVVLDGASEVVLVPDLHGFAHRRSKPRRHSCFTSLRAWLIRNAMIQRVFLWVCLCECKYRMREKQKLVIIAAGDERETEIVDGRSF